MLDYYSIISKQDIDKIYEILDKVAEDNKSYIEEKISCKIIEGAEVEFTGKRSILANLIYYEIEIICKPSEIYEFYKIITLQTTTLNCKPAIKIIQEAVSVNDFLEAENYHVEDIIKDEYVDEADKNYTNLVFEIKRGLEKAGFIVFDK